MNKNIHIYIDPATRVLYGSFYILGIYQVYGKRNVSFSAKYFQDLKKTDVHTSYEHYMAFVIVKEGSQKRIIIDYRDLSDIESNSYDWCDVYAKINCRREQLNSQYSKLVSIPPGFGIKIWSLCETIWYALSNSVKCKFKMPVKLKTFYGGYKRTFNRPTIEEYVTDVETISNYVFMIGTAWPVEIAGSTNLLRKQFADTCIKSGTNFEGGFVCKESHPQYSVLKTYLLHNRYTSKQYLTNTKKSSIVFNTPAVFGCHGWKLGEYIAMGKAIVSTKFVNEIYPSLVDGENIVFVDENEMDTVVRQLLQSPNQINKLENGTRIYWDKYANPKSVIEKIVCAY